MKQISHPPGHSDSDPDRPAAREWVVLWHSPEATDWMRQWMPVVADLGLDVEAPREHPARAADAPRESKVPPANTPSVAPAEP